MKQGKVKAMVSIYKSDDDSYFSILKIVKCLLLASFVFSLIYWLIQSANVEMFDYILTYIILFAGTLLSDVIASVVKPDKIIIEDGFFAVIKSKLYWTFIPQIISAIVVGIVCVFFLAIIYNENTNLDKTISIQKTKQINNKVTESNESTESN